MKQTKEYHEKVKAFQREIGHQLYLCRMQQKLDLTHVAKITDSKICELEMLESGQGSRKRLWKILKLFNLYGKELCVTVKEFPHATLDNVDQGDN